MWLRKQLPVYSPLSVGAVIAGIRAALRPGDNSPSVALEGELTRRYRASSVLLTDSGTSALQLALSAAMAEQEKALVALPAYSCYNVATAGVGAQARAHLYDLDPRTLGPDFASLRTALEGGVRTVVIAHLYGVPVDIAEAERLCEAYGAVLIEDAAQGGGGRWKERALGNWGSVSVLSFGRGKGTTGGRGGALLAHDAVGSRLLERARLSLQSGNGSGPVVALTAQWLLARPGLYGVPSSLPFLKLGETIYETPWAPRPISPASSAALARTIPLADGEISIRQKNAARLSVAIESTSRVRPVKVPSGGESGYLRLPVSVTTEALAVFASARARRLGVMPAYPRALTQLEEFRESWVNRDQRFDGAVHLAEHLFTLPTHSLLREGDLAALDRLILSP